MKLRDAVGVLLLMFVAVGCATYNDDIKNLKLGMTPDEAREAMGSEPTTIRAAKVFDDGQTTEVWEYIPRITLNPKNYWLFFENGKLVQWGQPGDFAGKSGLSVPVEEYKAFKQAR